MTPNTEVATKSSGCRSLGITKPIKRKLLMNDDGWVQIPAATGGYGFICCNAGVDFALFSFTSAGVVTMQRSYTSFIDSDTNGYYCIYQSGTQVIIKNRTGSAKEVLLTIDPM